MKLLQFTDIHLTTPGQTISGRDPIANFDTALAHALERHADAEALFITGDLSDWGEAADYTLLRQRLASVPIPVRLCLGNHDDRAIFLSEFPELDCEGFVQGVWPLSLGCAITLDSWAPETHAGGFCAARADWLDRQLSDAEGPVWLFLHHNPVPTGIAPMDEIMLLDAARFKDALRPHREKIAHIFHGHCHLPLSGSLLGIPFSAPRGTNHAGWPDFGATRLLSSSDLPEAYAVIKAAPEQCMVTMVEYGYAGAIRSEGSPDYAAWDKQTMTR